jgi:16S rRNA (uracil1498-N3)-methyltransferase
LPKFFVSPKDIASDAIRITGEDCTHIRKVLRQKEGDRLTVSDGCGRDYICEITAVKKEEIITRIIASSPSVSEPAVRCGLFMALPKGEKMEYIIQKSVELGVSSIVPVACGRCVVRLSPVEGKKKQDRWQRIAEAAAKQCGRGIIPQVTEPVSFEQALFMMESYQNRAVCYEGEKQFSISAYLREDMAELAFLVGPEGGFDADEIALCQKKGVSCISLGRRILRAETAPLFVLSVFLYVTHNL